MPRSMQEDKAIQLAKAHWAKLAGCKCVPREIPEGKGYDLECQHKHIEVKGTKDKNPGFRLFTEREFDAARKDEKYEFWLFTHLENEPIYHRIPRLDIVSGAEIQIQWQMNLGKRRLDKYRENLE